MKRSAILICSGLGALAAFVIYGAASTKSASTDRSNRLARIEALMNEGGAKYRPSFFRKHTSPIQVAALAPSEMAVSEVTAPAAPAPVKKVADEKKKKADEAKKKKKKKKSGDTSPETPIEAAKSSDDEKKKDEAANAGGLNGGPSPSPNATANAHDPNQLPQTVDEWIAYLFTSPSFEKTSKLIQLAQIGVVKPEVFFPVVEQMLIGVDRLPDFAIMAIGSLPSVQSFQLLADIANEATLDEKLKSHATTYMQVYAAVEYVRFLATAAASSDTVAANDAILLIQRSLPLLKANLASTVATTSTTPSTSSTRTPASNVAAIYQQIQASLTALSHSSADGAVRAVAAQTAQQIALQLEAVSTPTTPAVNGSPT